jgi:hypothetical protein
VFHPPTPAPASAVRICTVVWLGLHTGGDDHRTLALSLKLQASSVAQSERLCEGIGNHVIVGRYTMSKPILGGLEDKVEVDVDVFDEICPFVAISHSAWFSFRR